MSFDNRMGEGCRDRHKALSLQHEEYYANLFRLQADLTVFLFNAVHHRGQGVESPLNILHFAMKVAQLGRQFVELPVECEKCLLIGRYCNHLLSLRWH